MSQNLKANSTESVAGLGTYTFTVKDAGLHYLYAQSTDCPPSGIWIQLFQNGNQIAITPSPPSNILSFSVDASVMCAAGDTLSVTISSGGFEDQLLNTVKTIIRVERRS